MADDDHKTSAQLQREIDAHRGEMEHKIDEIQARLSPGQLVDELLSYSKGGGQQFVTNLGDTVSRNPLPVALLGVSLAWLIAGPRGGGGNGHASQQAYPRQSAIDPVASMEHGAPTYSSFGEYHDLPYAKVQGPVQRLGHITDEAGKRYSEFTDDAGQKFRALTNEAGHRAGNFLDETGRSFRGFTDAAGNVVEQFQDEAGNLIDEAAGWASQTFRMASDAVDNARRGIGHQASAVGHQAQQFGNQAGHMAMQAGDELQHQADRLMRETGKLLNDQPLIGGALAFAFGAALGAVLPRTEQEDKLIGGTADDVKATLGQEAGKLYEEGKEQVAHVYEDVRDKAGELYGEAKDAVIGMVDTAAQPEPGSPNKVS